MKFLVDAQLPPGMCTALETFGHDAVHTFERPGAGATDAALVELAAAESRIIITKDADFLQFALRGDCRCVLLLCGNTTNRALREWLVPRWAGVERELEADVSIVEVR